MRAERARLVCTSGRADQCSHTRTGRNRQLDGELSDAAGRAGHEHTPAENRAVNPQCPQRRQPRDGKRRGLLERDRLGQLRGPPRRHRNTFRPARTVNDRDDALALGRAAAVARLPQHDARDVLAGPPPVGTLLEEPQLAAVDGERAHVQDELVGAGLGLGQVGREPQAVGSAGVGDEAAQREEPEAGLEPATYRLQGGCSTS